jgi:hypothetical protein
MGGIREMKVPKSVEYQGTERAGLFPQALVHCLDLPGPLSLTDGAKKEDNCTKEDNGHPEP